MNSAIRRLAVAAIVLMLALLANATYIQAFRAQELNERNDNRRVRDDQFSVDRGPILVAGQPVAESKPSNDRFVYQRTYSNGPLYAHTTGYYSYLYGRSGIEQTENSQLNGSDPSLVFRRLIDMVTGKRQQGASVALTLNPRAQKAAADGLNDKNFHGAVVALDPKTGAVLASVSAPSYDPNLLASHDLKKVNESWKQLTTDPDQPMLNRAVRETYPPGSTFKLVTLAAALSSGKYNKDTPVDSPARMDLPQTSADLVNHDGRNCGGSNKATLLVALRNSCNTSFGRLGLDLGADALREQSEKFGFGERHLPELGGVASQFPEDPNEPQLAQSAIGQFDVRATPLQMAMVAAGIANGGEVMKPYVVASVRTADLKTIEQTKPEALHQAVTPEVADQITQMMVDVVDNGTGEPARMQDVQVAGKTGTAQTSADRPPYAWFVAFAPADDPKVAVAVAIEKAGVDRSDIAGGRLAGPIAKDVIQAVINQ
ncbi:MAG: peptidoglycan D,D-transpeptidase FtsI family protein [Kribbellaceae bacterium]|nr:penicillin-binding protein 2 [Kribbellaceae bacterium]